jgi:ribosome maturation factor RimP
MGDTAHFLFVREGQYKDTGVRDLGELIEQAVTGLGFELVTIESSPRARLLRVFIDIARGVNVDDCATVSNHLTRLFEVENVDYDRLEVSSPGLDRPLIKPADFERFAGQEIRLRTCAPVGSQRNFTGVLQGLRDGAVVVDTDKGELLVAFDDVEKARLVPKF